MYMSNNRNLMRLTLAGASLVAALILGGCATGQSTGGAGSSAQNGVQDKIVENFNTDRIGFQIKTFQSSDGSLISEAAAKPVIETSGGTQDSGSLRIAMNATLTQIEWTQSWDESYLFFHSYLIARLPVGGTDGMVLSLKPEAFTTFEIGIIQQRPDGEHNYTTTMNLPEGKWTTVRLPWTLLQGSGPSDRPDPSLPATVILTVPFKDNWTNGSFGGSADLSAGLWIDDVGTWTGKIPDAFDDFEPIVRTASWTAEVYGLPVMVTYDESGNAEAFIPPGVSNYKLVVEPESGSGSGTVLSIKLEATLDSAFGSVVDRGLTLGIGIYGRGSRPIGEASAVEFHARADQALTGGFKYIDIEDDWRSYDSHLSLNDFWTRVEIPLSELQSDGMTLSDAARTRERPWIGLTFDISTELLKTALEQGKLSIRVQLDDIYIK